VKLLNIMATMISTLLIATVICVLLIKALGFLGIILAVLVAIVAGNISRIICDSILNEEGD
jgi:hypothetical protein